MGDRFRDPTKRNGPDGVVGGKPWVVAELDAVADGPRRELLGYQTDRVRDQLRSGQTKRPRRSGATRPVGFIIMKHGRAFNPRRAGSDMRVI